MKIYRINEENEVQKTESFGKISLVRTGDRVTDVILEDGHSIFESYLKEKYDSVYIKEHYGNYNDEKSLIVEIGLSTIGLDKKVVLVSSVTGRLIKDENNNPYLKYCFDRTGVSENPDKWKTPINLEIHNFRDEGTFIDYGGNFILGHESWFHIKNFADNMCLLTVGMNQWVFNEKTNKLVTKRSFKKINICPDKKHILFTSFVGGDAVIDLDGNLCIGFSPIIIPAKLTFSKERGTVYYYIVNDIDNILYDENFNEIINFTKNDWGYYISNSTYSSHILIGRNGLTEFNILNADFKPMFSDWLDSVDYGFFKNTSIFRVHNSSGYLIMDGKDIKPWDKCKIWVEDIVKLESLTSRNENIFAVKINENNCFIIRLTSYPRVGLYCEEIKEDEYGTVYLTDNENSTILKLFPHNSGVSRLDGDLLLPTYFNTTFIVRKDDKYNFCKCGSEGIYFYFTEGQWLDDVYCTDDRFVIIKRDGEYNYFDTTAFKCHFPEDRWYKDVEPAEETMRGWRFRVKTVDGKWIEQDNSYPNSMLKLTRS